MKTIYIYIFILFNISIFNSCERNSTQIWDCELEINNNTEPVSYKVLFIGNSHTYVNDIPQTIKNMALSKGDTIQTHQETPGGYTLKQHSTRPETLNAIKSEKWDFVILQGVGGLQAIPPSMADTAFNRYAQILADSIRKNSITTKIILYMTHGYKDGVLAFNDYEWCEVDPFVCDYYGMQERIRYNYISLGNILNAEVAPCGVMWKIIMDNYPDIILHSSDRIHATPCGSYISACTIYSLIFKKRPENIYKPENISEDNAQHIQSTVSNSLFDCNPNWKLYPIK